MELEGGNVKEVFRHLKGWYHIVTEMQAKPCRQTILLVRWMSGWIYTGSPLGTPYPSMFIPSRSVMMHPPMAKSELRRPNCLTAKLLVPPAYAQNM